MPRYQCVCGAKFRFLDSAIGKKAKCKRCGAVFTLADEDGPIPIADEPPAAYDSPLADEFAGNADIARSQAASNLSGGGGPLSPSVSPQLVDLPSPARGYFEAILWTIFFPSSIRNMLTYLAIWIGLAVSWILPCYTWVFLSLWYAAFRFAVIESGAAGDKFLPEVGFSRDDMVDAVGDALRWIGSWAVALAPAVIYFLIEAGSGGSGAQQTVAALAGGVAGLLLGSGTDPVLVTLLAAGLFMWPIIVLVITLGGFECLYRVDLMFITIARSFPAYLVTLALVFGATVVEGVMQGAVASGIGARVPGGIGTAIGGFLAGYVLSVGIPLYCNIVMLRAIGLYYRHFKHKFAWDWG